MFTDWKGVAVLVVGGGVLLYLLEKQAQHAIVAAAENVAPAVDITSKENIVYRGFSRLLDGIANDGQQLDWWTRTQKWYNETF